MQNQEQSVSNPDMEMMLLSCIIKTPEWFYAHSEELSHDIFTSKAHSYIYRSIVYCSEHSSIDIKLIEDYCNRKFSEQYYNESNMDIIEYLYETANRADITDKFPEYLKVLNQYKTKRQLIRYAKSLSDSCFEDLNIDKILSQANRDLANIENVGDIHDFDLDDLINQTYQKMTIKEDKDFVYSYFKELDDFIVGWEAPDLVLIAGRPGMGKTAIALSLFKENIKRGHFGAFFSLEMNATQLMTRIFASEATIDLKSIRKGYLGDSDQESLGRVAEEYRGYKMFIDDKSTHLSKIITKCKKLKKQHDLKFVVIDYLQLMKAQGEDRQNQISSISRSLKQMARELDIPVIALSQLSRAVEQRGGDKKPLLSDLRESGSLEQDADMVIFAYRDAYYHPEDHEGDIQDVELIVAKGRSTGTDTVKTHFIPQYQQFILDPKKDPRMNTIISRDIAKDFSEPMKNQNPTEEDEFNSIF